MRVYVEIARRSFQRYLAYRRAALAGIFTNSVFGVMIASVYIGFYQSQSTSTEDMSVAGWTLPEMMTFVWVSQALIMVIYMWGWVEVAQSIQNGDVVTDLMRPLDYFTYWLSRDLGRAVCHALVRGGPTLLVGALVYDMALPERGGVWAIFLISVALAVVISFAWRFILNISTFWFLDYRGAQYIGMVLLNFFSGFLLPISFFPGWLRTIAELLPFRAIVMVPNQILVGQTPIIDALALQVFWAIALCLVARLVLARAERKVVVQGG